MEYNEVKITVSHRKLAANTFIFTNPIKKNKETFPQL